MKEFAIRTLRSALKDTEKSAKKNAGERLEHQLSYEVGYLKQSIVTALKELEKD